MDHLRELRTRVVRGLLAIVVGTVAAFAFYEPILNFLTKPYTKIQPLLEERGIKSDIVITGIGGAFNFQIKICLVVGILVASPFWLWQMWAFILPAMHRNEKRWAALLAGTGAPLFIGGAAFAYLLLPKAMNVLLGFVPDGFGSLVTGAEYFNFIIRMMLVFGVACEIPLVVVMLNRLGLVNAKQLARSRPWIILLIFVFAAVATPTTDPLTMVLLAAPMTILYFLSEIIARITDRRRAKVAKDADLPDDQLSSLDD